MDKSNINKPKKKKIKAAPILIFILLLGYFVMQGYLISRNKIETIKATEGFINDSILSSGILCREESILPEQAAGIIDYKVDNGQRVSSGMVIGNIYNTTQDIENIKRVSTLEKEIENIKSAQSFMSSANVDISVTRKLLNTNIISISQDIATGNYSSIMNILPSLTLNINKINVAAGKGGNLDNTKDEISQMAAETQQAVPEPIGTIYSQQAGYFIKSLDGYESIATVENFKNLSSQEGEALILKPNMYEPSLTSSGKIITDYKWSLCTYLTDDELQKLQLDSSVKLALDSQQNQYQKAVIIDIVKQDGKSLVILQSTTMDVKSATNRIVDCEILFRQYKGIKIPKSALHIVDENLGVYVKVLKQVQFKKVKPLFEDKNYVILPLSSDENNEVILFDDIIVKGVNLYHGKYL